MIYICIPTHNEQQTVGVVLWKLRQVLTEFHRDYQLLVADDASTDRTIDVLEPYTRVLPLTVIRSETRQGYAASLEMLLREAVRRSEYPKRDVIVTLQADFSEEPDDIVGLIKRMEAGADVAVGIKVGASRDSRLRRFARTLSGFFARRQTWPEGVVTPFDGYRAYRLHAIKRAIEDRDGRRLLRYDGWAGHAELLRAVLPHARRVDTINVEDRPDRLQRPRRERPLAAAWQVRAMASGAEPTGLTSVEELDRIAATASRARDRSALLTEARSAPRPNGRDRRRPEGRGDSRRERGGRTDRAERPERTEGARARPERRDRPARGERSDRPERPERPERGERTDRPERAARSPDARREGRREHSQGERPHRAERAPRGDRPTRPARPPRAEREAAEQETGAGAAGLTGEELIRAATTGAAGEEAGAAAPKKRRRRRRGRGASAAANPESTDLAGEDAAARQAALTELDQLLGGLSERGGDADDGGGADDDAATDEAGGDATGERKRRRRGGRRGGRGRRRGPRPEGEAGADAEGGQAAAADAADGAARQPPADAGAADPVGRAAPDTDRAAAGAPAPAGERESTERTVQDRGDAAV